MRALYLVLLAAVAALGFLLAQTGGPNDGVDGYGAVSSYEGTLIEHPYAALLPSGGSPRRAMILTATGKSDAGELVRGLDGRRVRIRGTSIARANLAVLEVVSVEELGPGEELAPPASLGAAELRGEIVDTKCALGRMKPGTGVLHRECAIRCIQGGIPPTLMTIRADGTPEFLLLEDLTGAPVNEAVVPFVADPVQIRGERLERAGVPVLRFDPAQIERL